MSIRINASVCNIMVILWDMCSLKANAAWTSNILNSLDLKQLTSIVQGCQAPDLNVTVPYFDDLPPTPPVPVNSDEMRKDVCRIWTTTVTLTWKLTK
jgi:hypothetical protein